MTTIDDAIKHEEERAADLESTCTLWKSLADSKGLTLPSDYEFCKSDAEDHRQVAAWLKELKALKEAPKGDLISRDALKHRFAQITYIRFTADMGQGGFEMFSEKEIEKIINNAPAVDISGNEYFPYRSAYFNGVADGRATAIPQGEWIEGKNGNIKCNQCGCEIRYSYLTGNEPDFPKFCPNCGAKMKGGAE